MGDKIKLVFVLEKKL